MADDTKDSVVQVEEKISYTKSSQFSCEWSVSMKDLNSFNAEDPDVMTSETFSPGNWSKWCLKLERLEGTRIRNRYGHWSLSLQLYLLSCDRPSIRAKFTFTAKAPDKSKLTSMTSREDLTFKPGMNHGFEDFATTHDLGLTNIPLGVWYEQPNTVLFTFLCEVTIFDLEVVNHPGNNIVLFNLAGSEVQDNLSSLFETQVFSDVTLDVCGRELRAHKAILVMRSRVFSAMFNHEMVEKIENKVKVTDVDYETFYEMLRFVYTGKVTDIDKRAGKLLAAANKYELERLKDMCQEALHSNLTIDNAVDVLILADLYNAEKLKAQAVVFIYENGEKVLETDGFRSMTTSHPTLVAEILRFSVTKKNGDARKLTQISTLPIPYDMLGDALDAISFRDYDHGRVDEWDNGDEDGW